MIIHGISFECLGDLELDLKVGDKVVLLCERYSDLATITDKIGEPIEDVEEFERQRSLANKGRHIEGSKTATIERKATAEDLAKIVENDKKAQVAYAKTKERIMAHGLEMKLIDAHYSLDCRLLLFQFSADGRIDFRELLRDLSTLFSVRIELRQIGVRDEASMLGGIGTCGRPFCCSKFLHTFNSINVKMAKQQGISLNPQNISGCCGRLKCCLYYEAYAYKDVALTPKDKSSKLKVDEMDEKELAKLDARESSDSSNEERQANRPQRNASQRPREPRQNNGDARQRPREQSRPTRNDSQKTDTQRNREQNRPSNQRHDGRPEQRQRDKNQPRKQPQDNRRPEQPQEP